METETENLVQHSNATRCSVKSRERLSCSNPRDSIFRSEYCYSNKNPTPKGSLAAELGSVRNSNRQSWENLHNGVCRPLSKQIEKQLRFIERRKGDLVADSEKCILRSGSSVTERKLDLATKKERKLKKKSDSKVIHLSIFFFLKHYLEAPQSMNKTRLQSAFVRVERAYAFAAACQLVAG